MKRGKKKLSLRKWKTFRKKRKLGQWTRNIELIISPPDVLLKIHFNFYDGTLKNENEIKKLTKNTNKKCTRRKYWINLIETSWKTYFYKMV